MKTMYNATTRFLTSFLILVFLVSGCATSGLQNARETNAGIGTPESRCIVGVDNYDECVANGHAADERRIRDAEAADTQSDMITAGISAGIVALAAGVSIGLVCGVGKHCGGGDDGPRTIRVEINDPPPAAAE